MKADLWKSFITTIQKEVVPALGCTEPISVALAAAIAASNLSGKIEKIVISVSPNLMKNGMGVGIPGTGMVGLPIAAAIGALEGDPDAGLEVLKNITPAGVNSAKALLGCVITKVADVTNPLYAQVTLSSATEFIEVTIADSHTNVLSIKENGITTYLAPAEQPADKSNNKNTFEGVLAKDVYEFAMNVPLVDIAFIQEAQVLNQALSEEGLKGDYGLQTGKTFKRNVERGLLSLDLLTDVIMRSSAASDARMDGVMKPAMSNSGSGNQGIAATMPIVAAADYLKSDPEQATRALILSHLMAIYIKQQQSTLSALCAVTTAGMGATAGITYLLGGDYKQVSYAISSMIGEIAGIICDGAKPSCALKVSSASGSAVKAALMALDGVYVTGNEGIVSDDVDQSIANLCALANGAMTQTDVQILDIMVNKVRQ